MKNKPKNLDKKDTRDRGLVIALVVVIALLVLVVVIMSFGIANKVEEKPIGLTWNWLEENCECLEFEGELVCLKDFELRGDLCWRWTLHFLCRDVLNFSVQSI